MAIAGERELEPIPGVVVAFDAIAARGLVTCVTSQGPLKKMAVSLAVTGARAAGMAVLDPAGAALFQDMAELPGLLGLG